MSHLRDINLIADFAHRWITEVVWPYIGGQVSVSIRRLQQEGFSYSEASFWLEALTILQIYRMGYVLPTGSERITGVAEIEGHISGERAAPETIETQIVEGRAVPVVVEGRITDIPFTEPVGPEGRPIAGGL